MNYDLVIFDFDGTLADTFPWFCSIINGVADKYHFHRVAESQLDEFRSLSATEIIQRLEVPGWRLPAIAAHVRSLMAAQISQIGLFPGVAEAIYALRALELRIGIVSSNSRDNIARILGAELSRAVEHFECGSSLFGKARRIGRLLDHSGVGTGRAIYIGDETRDAQAARQLGMDFGGVSWGYNTREALSARGPVLIFDKVTDLAEKLRA